MIMLVVIIIIMTVVKYLNCQKTDLLCSRKTKLETPLRVSHHPTNNTFVSSDKDIKGGTIHHDRYPASHFHCTIIRKPAVMGLCYVFLLSDCLPF